ncbi:hypothetical protein [Clostridium tyrobutyricum]|uniref:hypothetical protein n=1 Tax=Clostridium tyrobutyricum TaxID=1519 RepID=UPI001C387B10|nr:hypothetical protein [Clostridium tyrobutyricum]MBV4422954.1 hypothetical protein [Clostridium tyrobutyricum]
MSYGTCKRAYKKIVCPICGRKEEISPIQQTLFRIYRGKQNRYLCRECYKKAFRTKESDINEL